MSQHCKNTAGMIKIREATDKGSICNVVTRVRQVWNKILNFEIFREFYLFFFEKKVVSSS